MTKGKHMTQGYIVESIISVKCVRCLCIELGYIYLMTTHVLQDILAVLCCSCVYTLITMCMLVCMHTFSLKYIFYMYTFPSPSVCLSVRTYSHYDVYACLCECIIITKCMLVCIYAYSLQYTCLFYVDILIKIHMNACMFTSRLQSPYLFACIPVVTMYMAICMNAFSSQCLF